ncbi:RND transporter [uncultured Lentibacter sp.]|uniref:RND transporter n=1 Tax=uncultured Lentibacter sp. TaxID=1659309 RepID=UPI002608E497|nr:RND transporter [uncultured Lentibacter sp.]MCW1955193.1 RND transporter [Roseobacter sp.]
MRNALTHISWPIALLLALTLGLAPFFPEPHIWEKLKLLIAGELRAVIDIFDLLMHGAPWVLLGAKLVDYLARPTN